MEGKICPKCNKWKQANQYHKSNSTLSGLTSVCKLCDSKRIRKTYNAKRDEGSHRNKLAKDKVYLRRIHLIKQAILKKKFDDNGN